MGRCSFCLDVVVSIVVATVAAVAVAAVAVAVAEPGTVGWVNINY